MVDQPDASSEQRKPTTPPARLESEHAGDGGDPPQAQTEPEEEDKGAPEAVGALPAVRRGAATVIRFLDDHNGAVTAVATVAIAVLTALYVHYSRGQWDTMERQLSQSERSAEISQRAWVLVKSYSPAGMNEGGNASVEVIIENAGKSPATNIVARQGFGAFKGAFSEKIGVSDAEVGTTVLAPGETTWIKQGIDEVPQWFSGGLNFYVWGRIQYVDDFGVQRCLRYCRHLQDHGPPGAHVFLELPDWNDPQFTPCVRFNGSCEQPYPAQDAQQRTPTTTVIPPPR